MVLSHIRDRCERILKLDSKSPVAMILSALELLLQHSDDWEAYANRDNSLKSFQQEVSALIIAWRRLELSSWVRLLEDQAEQYISNNHEWTLRLYGALIYGAAVADDITKHIETVLPLINTYLSKSTLGHFESQLEILVCFQRQAWELGVSSISTANHLRAIAIVLHNVIANAQLFLGEIRHSLKSQRGVIDQSIRDFIKLASWKDVNVFALKASAQRSHRQLHRSIRKFREVLQQPVAPILTNINAICLQENPQMSTFGQVRAFLPSLLVEEAGKARLDIDPLPNHLSRLTDTLDRYHRILEQASPENAASSGSQVDSMVVDVIETVIALAQATPATMTKGNIKVVKNLDRRKRKAFADLLKALRACGFSQSVRADLLQCQQSVKWFSERSFLAIQLCPRSIDTANLVKIESYHHRQALLMRALRGAFNGHHSDIASQDLQRGIGFTESLVATAIAERDQYVLAVPFILLMRRLAWSSKSIPCLD